MEYPITLVCRHLKVIAGGIIVNSLVLLCILVALVTKAHAHDFWANGKEVDPATKRICCGQADAQQLDPSKVHAVVGGYKLDDTGEVIPYERAQPSPDGKIWAFRWGGGTQCFFAPPPSI